MKMLPKYVWHTVSAGKCFVMIYYSFFTCGCSVEDSPSVLFQYTRCPCITEVGVSCRRVQVDTDGSSNVKKPESKPPVDTGAGRVKFKIPLFPYVLSVPSSLPSIPGWFSNSPLPPSQKMLSYSWFLTFEEPIYSTLLQDTAKSQPPPTPTQVSLPRGGSGLPRLTDPSLEFPQQRLCAPSTDTHPQHSLAPATCL